MKWLRYPGTLLILALTSSAVDAAQPPSGFRPRYILFVSPTGTAANSGTLDSPWSLDHALKKAEPNATITLLPGTYPSISVRTRGLTIRAHSKWAAKVRGSPEMHGIEINAPNVVIDGLQIAHSYIDGVKLNAGWATIRDCWIHHSGLGNPAAVANSNMSFTGQGIYSGCHTGSTIARNLIEYNGVCNRYDHGVYMSGTNHLVYGNVIRHNWAYGLQLYTGSAGKSCSGIMAFNNLIYDNGRGNGLRSCVTVWAGPPGVRTTTTNYLFSNTLVSDNYHPVISNGGHLGLTNNILVGVYEGRVIAATGGTVSCDYNLLTHGVPVGTGVIDGGHNLIKAEAAFLRPTTGLYWLASHSRARGAAASVVIPPSDFFGNAGTVCRDIGAFQYNPILENDMRVLDPSPTLPDYWSAH